MSARLIRRQQSGLRAIEIALRPLSAATYQLKLPATCSTRSATVRELKRASPYSLRRVNARVVAKFCSVTSAWSNEINARKKFLGKSK
jgi:hypothetical protein